jgi:ribonuclease Z
MGIAYRVLGWPGFDNALFVRVDAGQALHRLLFDCGEACLYGLTAADVLGVDHLCFSHLHMDHVGGFDTFFRANYARETRPNVVWGPPRTAEILHHRFRGYMWNLYAGDPGVWEVGDVFPDRVERTAYYTAEAFAGAHPLGTAPFAGTLLDTPDYALAALHMDHHTPSLAYVLREKPRVNVDVARLAALGLTPGPWLRVVRDRDAGGPATVEVGGATHEVARLRRELLVETPGDSIAYLTDFLLDDAARERLLPALGGVRTVVCECQYRAADGELALKNRHMTSAQVAALARDAGVGELVLFHLSSRYRPPEWRALLEEVRAIFPAARFPEGWDVEAAAGGDEGGPSWQRTPNEAYNTAAM